MQAVAMHFENADLVGRAVSVLYRSYDPVALRPLTLEVKHRVDHVFKYLRSGDRSFLRYVTDKDHGYVVLLGYPHET